MFKIIIQNYFIINAFIAGTLLSSLPFKPPKTIIQFLENFGFLIFFLLFGLIIKVGSFFYFKSNDYIILTVFLWQFYVLKRYTNVKLEKLQNLNILMIQNLYTWPFIFMYKKINKRNNYIPVKKIEDNEIGTEEFSEQK